MAKEQARELAKLLSYSQRGVFETVNVLQMRLTIYPPDKKIRDLDNVLTSMKSAIDGVCKGLEIDDSQIRRVMLEWGGVVKGGAVELLLNMYGVSYP